MCFAPFFLFLFLYSCSFLFGICSVREWKLLFLKQRQAISNLKHRKLQRFTPSVRAHNSICFEETNRLLAINILDMINETGHLQKEFQGTAWFSNSIWTFVVVLFDLMFCVSPSIDHFWRPRDKLQCVCSVLFYRMSVLFTAWRDCLVSPNVRDRKPLLRMTYVLLDLWPPRLPRGMSGETAELGVFATSSNERLFSGG